MRIVLHGKLKDLYPHPVELHVRTVAEAIEALCLQTKAFTPKPGQDRHCVQVVGFDTLQSLYEPTDVEEIHVVPSFEGAKGAIQIVVGAVLVALSFVPGVNAIAGGYLASFLFSAGVSMVAGGLIQLLSPAPTADVNGGQNADRSKYLGTPKNTVAIGTRIPLLYGRHRVYGHFLSFDIDSNAAVVLS